MYTEEYFDQVFSYHTPGDDDVAARHGVWSQACRRLAVELDVLAPDGEEKDKALIRIQEAMMWGNAGIAREGK